MGFLFEWNSFRTLSTSPFTVPSGPFTAQVELNLYSWNLTINNINIKHKQHGHWIHVRVQWWWLLIPSNVGFVLKDLSEAFINLSICKASKNYILHLCQLPRLTIWGHKVKAPMPHLESYKSPPCLTWISQNKLKNNSLPHHQDWVFIVKFKIKFLPALWLSIVLWHRSNASVLLD